VGAGYGLGLQAAAPNSEDAIGPEMAWLIPIRMAYIPALVIGLLGCTLVVTLYPSTTDAR